MKFHIYKTALALFACEGYESATLRKIAKKAKVSPGLLYKYYPNKSALVLELYDELSKEFEINYKGISGTSWRIRTVETLKLCLKTLSPHRETLTALLPVLVGDREKNLFASATKFSRDRVEGGFAFAIQHAKNKPTKEMEEPLSRLLYTVHLGIILLWLMDKSSNQSATKQAIKLMPTFLWWMSLGLRFSRGQKLVTQLNEIISKGLIGK
jgi:AcrR family transcriptional regulator